MLTQNTNLASSVQHVSVISRYLFPLATFSQIIESENEVRFAIKREVKQPEQHSKLKKLHMTHLVFIIFTVMKAI